MNTANIKLKPSDLSFAQYFNRQLRCSLIFIATDTVGAENKLTHLSFSTTGAISRRTTKDNKQCIRIQGHDFNLSC
jgi:hypothetical protein